MIIRLNWSEMLLANHVASMRQVGNMKEKRQPRYGAHPVVGVWQKHIISCQSEMAVAKMLNLYWSGEVGNLKAADVGNRIEVRSTERTDGRLMLHPDDANDSRFYLVRATPPDYNVVGWIVACDGKKEEYWETHTSRPAFFVPNDLLKGMEP